MSFTKIVPSVGAGRPVARPRTFRILKQGVARLSADLCHKPYRLVIEVNKKRQIVFFRPAKGKEKASNLWFTPAAKSALISFRAALNALGKTWEEVMGEYEVTVVGKRMFVNLRSKKL